MLEHNILLPVQENDECGLDYKADKLNIAFGLKFHRFVAVVKHVTK